LRENATDGGAKGTVIQGGEDVSSKKGRRFIVYANGEQSLESEYQQHMKLGKKKAKGEVWGGDYVCFPEEKGKKKLL